VYTLRYGVYTNVTIIIIIIIIITAVQKLSVSACVTTIAQIITTTRGNM